MFAKLICLIIVLSVIWIAVNAGAEPTALGRSRASFESLLKRAATAANVSEIETQTSNIIQTNLRTVNEESRFLQGYMFTAVYSGSDCDDADLSYLSVTKLNQCISTCERVESYKLRSWITVRGNLGITQNIWSDGHCTNDLEKQDTYLKLNECAGDVKIWVGPLPTSPPSFPGGTVGLFQFSDNRKCLTTNDFMHDFDYVEFYPIGQCIEYSDAMITGCDETGLHVQTDYSEADGTCTGTFTPHTYNPKNVCLWYDFLALTTYSWTRYQCF